MTHTTDYEALGRGPILPPEPPAPSNLFCPTMGRRMIYAPPYMSLSDQGKAVYWDIYFAGRDDEALTPRAAPTNERNWRPSRGKPLLSLTMSESPTGSLPSAEANTAAHR